MQYNVSFEVCAAIMLTIFAVFTQIGNPVNTRSSRAYISLCICIIITCLTDITSALLINSLNTGADIPISLAYGVNILYFIFSGINGYYFCYYVHTAASEDAPPARVLFLILGIPEIAFSIFAVLTPWTKLLFYFDENNNYCFGSMHIISEAILAFYIAAGLIFIAVNQKHFTLIKTVSCIVFTLAAAGGMFIQSRFMPDMCIGFAATAIAVMMLYFSLQCPSQYTLMRTLDELKAAKESLESASKAKEDFLKNISHEMRTPVNSILGMNRMILRKSFDKEIIKYAETAENSGEKLLHLINNILDYTQLNSGSITLAEENYSTRQLFEELIDEFAPLAKRKGVLLDTDIPSDIPQTLSGDYTRVKQIISNLLSNAVNYTEKGQVKLSAYYMPAGQEHIRLTISVSDTGCGMKYEDIPGITEGFIHLEENGSTGIAGAGLGLPIVKLLLSTMNGHIEIQSTCDKGSTFTVDFLQKAVSLSPMGQISAEHTGNKKSQNSFTVKDADILITDDSEVNIFVLHEFLKQFGINADTAGSGEECYELACRKNYDIIFLDHMMPDPDGMKTMKMIRETSGCASSGSIIIVATANAVTGTDSKYISEGFNDCIPKPVDPKKLSQLLLKYIPSDKIVHHNYSLSETRQSDIFSQEQLSHINTASGLALCQENRLSYASVLDDFAEIVLSAASKLDNALNSDDMQLYADISADIKNHAFNAGAENLSDIASLQEKFARSGKKNDAEMLHFDFSQALSAAAAEALNISAAIKEEY